MNMNRFRSIGLAVFAAIVFSGGAFGVSALAIEWRRETSDSTPKIIEMQDLQSEVSDTMSLLEPLPTVSPSSTDIQQGKGGVSETGDIAEPPPTPGLTPAPIVLPLEAGASIEWRGMRMTVESVDPNPVSGVASFTIENFAADDEAASAFSDIAVPASDGSFCRHGESFPSDYDVLPVERGQIFTFQISWKCDGDRVPIAVTFGEVVIFEFAREV